jgi:hypothetical protein
MIVEQHQQEKNWLATQLVGVLHLRSDSLKVEWPRSADTEAKFSSGWFTKRSEYPVCILLVLHPHTNDTSQSLGGAVTDTALTLDPTKSQVELTAYDSKVYKAQLEMHKAFTTQLKALGVPFFGMRTEALVKLKEAELLDLQRRMLNYLEEMYGP